MGDYEKRVFRLSDMANGWADSDASVSLSAADAAVLRPVAEGLSLGEAAASLSGRVPTITGRLLNRLLDELVERPDGTPAHQTAQAQQLPKDEAPKDEAPKDEAPKDEVIPPPEAIAEPEPEVIPTPEPVAVVEPEPVPAKPKKPKKDKKDKKVEPQVTVTNS